MFARRILPVTLLVVLLSAVGPGFKGSFAIPPSIPPIPEAEPPRVEVDEIPVYFGDFIPDELLDGVIGDEWNDAGEVSLRMEDYRSVAYLKHDGEYLYLALEIATGKEFQEYSEGYVWFDNGDGSEFDAGDDIITVEGGQDVLLEADFYYTGKYDFRLDPEEGGTNNAWGIGTYDVEELSYVFEFLKELDSGDSLDVPLDPEGEVGVIFGFVGESSPPDEVTSKKWKVKIVPKRATLAAARKIASSMDRIMDRAKKIISDPPKPKVKVNPTSCYDPKRKELRIKPGEKLHVIIHEYVHFLLHTLLGDKAYKDNFGHGEKHDMTKEYGALKDQWTVPAAKSKMSSTGATEEGFASSIAAVLGGSPKWTDGKQEVNLEDGTITFKVSRKHPRTGKEETPTVTMLPFVYGKKVRFLYDITYRDGATESIEGPPLVSERVESSIQGTVYDILDGKANKVKDEDKDGLSVPLKKILSVIKTRKPKNFKEFIEELRKGLNPAEQKALDGILATHGLK